MNATVYTVNGAPLASANLSDGALLAKTSTTINGFPISSNVTLSASNLTMGALPNGTTATTQAVSDNSTKLATTQFVASSLASPRFDWRDYAGAAERDHGECGQRCGGHDGTAIVDHGGIARCDFANVGD